MPSRSEVEEFRSVQSALSARSIRALRVLWLRLDPSDRPALALALTEALPDLVQSLGEISAVAGADFYDAIREAAGAPGVYTAVVADVPPREQIAASVRWALSTEATLDNLEKVVDRLTKKPGRDSISESASGDPARPRYARVPSGAETCLFCAMLASRGAVYLSEETADGKDYHDHCDCAGVPLFDGDALPEGYDPDHYLAIYREQGGSSIDTTRKFDEKGKFVFTPTVPTSN